MSENNTNSAYRLLPFDRPRPDAAPEQALHDTTTTPQEPWSLTDQTARSRAQILRLRMSRPFLLYSCFVLTTSSFLLIWNARRFLQYCFAERTQQGHAKDFSWRLPLWEEVLESVLCVCIAIETAISIRIVGWRGVKRSNWLKFDVFVATVSILSLLGYVWAGWGVGGGVFGSAGTKTTVAPSALEAEAEELVEILEDIDLPFLMLRFLLQPVRVVSQLSQTLRSQRVRASMGEEINFSTLAVAESRGEAFWGGASDQILGAGWREEVVEGLPRNDYDVAYRGFEEQWRRRANEAADVRIGGGRSPFGEAQPGDDMLEPGSTREYL